MSRHLLRAAATGVVALVAGLLTAPSASADIRTFPDVGAHITSVRVSHGPRTVGITALDADIDVDSYYKFWVDTHSGNPGPEYKAEIYPGSDVLHLMRVANFASGGIKFDCEGFQGFAETDHESYVKVIVPRSCIGTPPRVRVAVVGYYNEDSDAAIDLRDWAPGTERFYRWVNR
jgi:hypothetical protein